MSLLTWMRMSNRINNRMPISRLGWPATDGGSRMVFTDDATQVEMKAW